MVTAATHDMADFGEWKEQFRERYTQGRRICWLFFEVLKMRYLSWRILSQELHTESWWKLSSVENGRKQTMCLDTQEIPPEPSSSVLWQPERRLWRIQFFARGAWTMWPACLSIQSKINVSKISKKVQTLCDPGSFVSRSESYSHMQGKSNTCDSESRVVRKMRNGITFEGPSSQRSSRDMASDHP